MPIQAVLDSSSYEQLDESLKSLYVASGDGFTIDLPEAEAEKLTRTLNEKLDNKRKELKNVHDRVKDFDGMDPAEVKEALELKNKLREKKLIEKGDYDAAKKELLDAETAKYTKLAEEFDAYVSSTSVTSLKQKLVEGYGVQAADAEDVADLLMLHKIQASRTPEGIDWVNKDSIGDKADLDSIMAEFKEAKPKYFDNDLTPGTGGEGGKGSGGATSKRKSEMTAKESSDYIKKHGQAAYHALPR